LPSTKDKKVTLIVPQQTVFEIQFALKDGVSAKSVRAIIRKKNVLGANNIQPDELGYLLIENEKGVFTGKLTSPKNLVQYEIYVRIIDYKGNIVEEKIADLKVTNKFRVLKKGTNSPVEDSRVLLYLYNINTRIFDPISPQVLPIENPSYTLPNGTLSLVLPNGRYKAEIETIGYEKKTTVFEVSSNSDYPTVYLNPSPFNIINTLKYYYKALNDSLTSFSSYLSEHTQSNRLFDLITLGALLIFVLTTTIYISKRTHISLFYIPFFLVHKAKFITKRGNLIYGRILDKGLNSPISRAEVFLIDSTENKIISKTKTNRLGEFFFNKPNGKDFKINVSKKGFISGSMLSYTDKNITSLPIVVLLEKEDKTPSGVSKTKGYIEAFLGLFTGFLLIGGIIVEIFFIYAFGFARIAPFLIISSLNIAMIFLFLYKPKSSN
jgi:hypothetical protein